MSDEETSEVLAGQPVISFATLRDCEAWFAEHRNGPFLSIMEREMVELPLVETC